MPKNKNNDFLKIIKTQRESKTDSKFRGTFLDYLELIRTNPDIAKLAHRRLCDAIEAHGVNFLEESDPRFKKLFEGEQIKIYDYFQGEFFGMETIISKITLPALELAL